MEAIYLDYNASAPFPKELTDLVFPLLNRSLGSPSSLHEAGRKSRRLINEATEHLASLLELPAEFIYWTSGASESNSWVFYSILRKAEIEGRQARFLISKIEHDSILLAAHEAKKRGAMVDWIPCLPNGQIDLSAVPAKLGEVPRTDLAVLMHANNETGVIQPIEEFVKICKQFGTYTLVDCVQTLGKVGVSASKLGATYLSVSGHKLGAPKGVGALCVNEEGQLLFPMIFGKQQKSLRGGTENTLSVAIFGAILSGIRKAGAHEWNRNAKMHEQFEARIQQAISGTVIHGSLSPRLPNTTYIGFRGIEGDSLILNLDLEGISASAGAACSSGSLDPSHVLMAMGCDKQLARSSVRFSSGPATVWQDFEAVLDVLPLIVSRMRGTQQ